MATPGMEHWKVTMLGDGGVGKTALAVQFTQKQFIETYDPTIEDSYRKQVFVDGRMSFLEIIDTAGQEDYSTLREQWIREGQGFILVYSVTNQTSFQNIDRFRKTMISLHAELPVFLIVGNKADDAYRREVSAEQGLTYARRHNCEFFEASAKNGQNVDRLFSEVVRQLRANSRPLPQPLTPNSTSTNGRGSSRTSASGFSSGGTATPLTVPSTGSLPHAALSGRSGSRNPFGTLADAASNAGNALAAPHLAPVPSRSGSGGKSPQLQQGMSSGSTSRRGGAQLPPMAGQNGKTYAGQPVPGRNGSASSGYMSRDPRSAQQQPQQHMMSKQPSRPQINTSFGSSPLPSSSSGGGGSSRSGGLGLGSKFKSGSGKEQQRERERERQREKERERERERDKKDKKGGCVIM